MTEKTKDFESSLKKLEKIVHPLVRKKLKSFLNKNKKKQIIVLDIPLLIENKLYNKKDILIFVKSILLIEDKLQTISAAVFFFFGKIFRDIC